MSRRGGSNWEFMSGPVQHEMPIGFLSRDVEEQLVL